MSLPPPLITRDRPRSTIPNDINGSGNHTPIQIPAAKFDLSLFDGDCVFDGANIALYFVGKFDIGVFG